MEKMQNKETLCSIRIAIKDPNSASTKTGAQMGSHVSCHQSVRVSAALFEVNRTGSGLVVHRSSTLL